MVKRFLITTALEYTWRDDVPVLFLGEWCRRFSRRERWEGMDALVMPYHWDDRARLRADYRYLLGLHEQLLKDLAYQLNALHGVSHGLRYWRILVGPWLGYFTQILFDRWTSIQEALGAHDISGTIVLRRKPEELVPADMTDFIRLFTHDEWNHHLYGLLLRDRIATTWVDRLHPVPASSGPATPAAGWQGQAKRLIGLSYERVASGFTRHRDAFFLSTYLPNREELTLQRRLGQVPQRWRPVPAATAAVDPARRTWLLSAEGTSGFETCVRDLIPRQIPAVYLEGYRRLIEDTEQLPWPRHPKVIWTSNAAHADEVFKAWAAARVEQGAPLVIGQHGGNYGTAAWSFCEDHEVAVCDRYLTWGWTGSRQPKVEPIGQLKLKRPTRVRHDRQPDALLVTCAVPRQSFCMASQVVARQWLDYFQDHCRFVEHLPAAIQRRLIVRLYPHDFGWDQAERWRDRFPDQRLDDGHGDIDGLIRHSRLYISTYNGTTFLESLTMNVPTVVYWNPKFWELRDSAVAHFEDLERVSVFHSGPESAARHVAAVWDDVGGWWMSAPVRAAVDRFKRMYCHLPEDLLDRIETTLRDVIASGGGQETSDPALDLEGT